jgi:hypothetical protein
MSGELAIEGTLEEIMERSPDLSGRRVRLVVLSDEPEPYPGIPTDQRPSTGNSLLKYAGTWAGDDLNDMLDLVHKTRSLAKF